LDGIAVLPSVVVTVCDQAHEELTPGHDWLHWSIADPVTSGTRSAFDGALAELRDRIELLLVSAGGSTHGATR
jgi:hypothetical protein